MKPSTVPFRYHPSGMSQDQRTNRWSFTCGCGKSFTPPTTRLAKQYVECPVVEDAKLILSKYKAE